MIHPFFTEIYAKPELLPFVNTTITTLPAAHTPAGTVKAILLGADPTNDGIRSNKGLIILEKVFGIDSKYEPNFFGLHMRNLKAIGLSKDLVYVQNVCKNYFTCQTNENDNWADVAEIWINYLEEELHDINMSVPVLATCEEVFTFLTGRKNPFTDIYKLESNLPFHSTILNRDVFPLFRSVPYILYEGKWTKYKNYLTEYFK